MKNSQNIKAMQKAGLYKYLGVMKTPKIDQQTMKTELTTEFVKNGKAGIPNKS